MSAASPRPAVTRFTALMEEKLKENDHKGGWGDETYEYLLARLQEETAEMRTRLGEWRRSRSSADTKRLAHEVAREAADVANFAMMVADNIGALEAK